MKHMLIHKRLIAFVITLTFLTLLGTSWLGTLKDSSDISPTDIIGEGGICLIQFLWIFVILISRPAGKVTQLLVVGISCVLLASLLDVMDEFYRYSQHQQWLTHIESIPAPIGMVILSYGLMLWHREQLSINQQLHRREHIFREHELNDVVTRLNSIDYMLKHIEMELSKDQDFQLLLLDLDDFDHFVSRHGDQMGNRLLRDVGELIIMNLRSKDLVCRYTADRFVVLLPDTSAEQANDMTRQLIAAVEHFAFKTDSSSNAYYHRLSSVSVTSTSADENTEAKTLIATLAERMEQLKSQKKLDAA